MLAIIAPDHPAQIAVTKVAMILQHTARATVLLCDSVILCPIKKPLSGLETRATLFIIRISLWCKNLTIPVVLEIYTSQVRSWIV